MATNMEQARGRLQYRPLTSSFGLLMAILFQQLMAILWQQAHNMPLTRSFGLMMAMK